MPNWCMNKLTVIGEDATLEKFKEAAHGETLLDFSMFVQYPEECKKEDEALGPDSLSAAGYLWCTYNWGTKWNACECDKKWHKKNRQISLCFETAWSPPIPVVDAMSKLFPELQFVLKYEEPDMEIKGTYKKGEGVQNENNSTSSKKPNVPRLDVG